MSAVPAVPAGLADLALLEPMALRAATAALEPTAVLVHRVKRAEAVLRVA